jgi:hypothetical protein
LASAVQWVVAWQGNSSDALAKTKNDYDAFLADKDNLHKVREQLKVGSSCLGPGACECGTGGMADCCGGHIA